MRAASVSAVCGAVLAAALAGAPASAAADVPLPPASARAAATLTPTAAVLPGAPTLSAAWVAHIVIPTRALSAPGHGRVKMVVPTSAVGDGGPVALLVLGARMTADGTTWLRVLLPERPDGISGWINSNFVELTRTPWRIDVSVEARTVSLLRDGRLVDRWQAVVGKPSTPTPRGLYAIYERVPQPSPNDFLGTWALLLTAFSPVLYNFDGGPGQVAIHGRGGASLLDPLGSARSHGCIRIDNSAIDVLARDVSEGTPVQIS
jgi:lipoprotein-anchoring transpeptidase ErfK/SrfK